MDRLLILLVIGFLSGCAGPNPNPGERTYDYLWGSHKYDKAVGVVQRGAKDGEPWAQIRLAQAYFFGKGVPKDKAKALKWYELAAVQTSDEAWANGQMIGAFGKNGWFGQNTDAMVAQYQLALIHFEGDQVPRNLTKARRWIDEVKVRSKGLPVYICCVEYTENGYWVTQSMIAKLDSDIAALESVQK